MALNALRGALGFLSRLPVGHSDAAWRAFRTTPAVFPAVGYVLGPLLALPLLAPVPAATAAVLFLGAVYAVTGINHVDGVADVGDAMVVHGDVDDRRDVMKDTAVGTGGALAVALVAFGLGAAGVALASLPRRTVALVVAAEVGAKLAMAVVVCLGTATHEGFGSAFTEHARPRSLAVVALVAAPAALVTWPRVLPALAAVAGGVVAALAALWWARRNLGGVNGDVVGAANELARVVALHAGVIAWTHS